MPCYSWFPALFREYYRGAVMTKNEKKELQIMACKIRIGVIEGTYGAKCGHPGGALSSADVLTYLYFSGWRFPGTFDPGNHTSVARADDN